MSKVFLFGIPVLFLGFLIYLITSSSSASETSESVKGITVEGDTQVIDITAKAGYFPRLISAEANKKTKLNINTKNTFDCSLALIIRDLGVNELLPQTGTTSYDIPPQIPGSSIVGNCSMGMYGFKIDFN